MQREMDRARAARGPGRIADIGEADGEAARHVGGPALRDGAGVEAGGPGCPQLGGDRLPEVWTAAVVTEGPHAGTLQIAAVHQVILRHQAGRVVVVELAPTVVITAARIVARRA